MILQKFGGSSVGSLERVQNVARIVAETPGEKVVVLSAMSGITDALILAGKQAASGADWKPSFEEIADRYRTLLAGVSEADRASAEARLHTLIRELEEVLDAIAAFRFCDVRMRDVLVSFGERMMCAMMPYFLRPLGLEAHEMDGRELIVTDETFGSGRVLFDETNYRLEAWRRTLKSTPVVTGFIAATREGMTTTLDRGGSDYTATIVGGGIGAERVEIWTDVDGAMTADPRIVLEAAVIHELSYEEAAEMAYFGAKVIHPLTLLPVAKKGIPVHIKNTFNPKAPGTIIGRRALRTESTSPTSGQHNVRSIATRSGLAIVSLEGGALSGHIGSAGRLFSALGRAKVNVIMISQASSEQSICFMIERAHLTSALQAIQEEFSREFADEQLKVATEDDVCIVAVIGDGMIGTPGIAGRVFSTLGRGGINVRAIAQGSSERNISAVVKEADKVKAARAIHQEYIAAA